MERSREAKSGASAPRRLRITCPKDPADAETRMDDTPLIEKVKKGNLQAFPVSFSATASAWNKRKRNGLQEAQILLDRINVGKEGSEMTPSTNITKDFAEELEMALSKVDEDEIPLLSNLRPLGRSAITERARDDELVMDTSKIPRRARSASSRFSSLRRQQEPCSAGASLQRAPTASQQRSPSPKRLSKRPAGTKSRRLKDFRVMENTNISDQEVEVAEVLFDLSRSMPSFAQSTSLIYQAKSCRGLEEEDLNSSSSQVAGNTVKELLQKSSCPLDEPRSKHQCASLQEQTICNTPLETVAAAGGGFVGPFGATHSSVMEVNQMGQAQNKHSFADEFFCHQPELMSSEVVTNPCYGDSRLRVVDDKNVNYFETRRSKEFARAKAMENKLDNSTERMFAQDSLALPIPSICKSELGGQVSGKDAEHSCLLSRSCEYREANDTSSKVDPTCLPIKVSTEEEGEDNMQADNKRFPLSESSSNFARDCGGKTLFATTEQGSKEQSVKGASAAYVKDESSFGTRLANGRNQELSKHTSSPWKEEQDHLRLLDVEQENDISMPDLHKDEEAGLVVSSSPLTIPVSSNNPVTWMGGFPPPRIYGKAAPLWPTNCSHLGTSLDRTSYPAIQLPHTRAQHSVPRMRRCATHVHVAHYIQQQQRSLRQAYWPPAYHSGTPYNPSNLPANQQGKEQWNRKDTYISALQAGRAHRHTPSECIGPGMPSSRGSVTTFKSESSLSVSSHSARVLSTGAGTGITLAAHALYSQSTMHQNGFSSLCVPSNGSPGQSASIFNRLFDPAHLSPQDLQSLAQQTSSMLRLPKYQEGPHSSSHGEHKQQNRPWGNQW